MELKGTIKSIGQTQSFGDNGFRKRELVLTTERTISSVNYVGVCARQMRCLKLLSSRDNLLKLESTSEDENG